MVLPKHISEVINEKSKENTLRSSAVKVYLIRSFKNDTSPQEALDDLIEYAVSLRRGITLAEQEAVDGLSELEKETIRGIIQEIDSSQEAAKVYQRGADYLISLGYQGVK